MDNVQRAANAKAIFAHPLFHEIMAGLERTAVDACIYAPATDHDTRAAYAAEVRAIRNLRSKIESIAKSDNSPLIKSVA